MPLNHRLGHLKITPGTLDQLLDRITADINSGKKTSCIPINVTKYSMAKRDVKLARAILECDYVIADGLPIVWLSWRLGLGNVHRITGIDLAEACLARACQEHWKVFLLGATETNLQAACDSLSQDYPGLSICGTRNGYYEDEEIPEIIGAINACSPDLLLVALGVPQKEHFVHDYILGKEAGNGDSFNHPEQETGAQETGTGPIFWSSSEVASEVALHKCGAENGDRSHLPERPGGCFAQIGPVPFSGHQINCRFCLTVGGAFDIWAKAKARAPMFIQSIGMEWLYRTATNPKKGFTLLQNASLFTKDILLGSPAAQTQNLSPTSN